jgi:nitrate/nitrite-specific signal transduction histidine kinase
MSIRDDGIGMGKDVGENTGKPGLGLRIMNYRAKMIEGTLQVQPDRDGGTVVTCRWQPAGRSEEPSVTW